MNKDENVNPGLISNGRAVHELIRAAQKAESSVDAFIDPFIRVITEKRWRDFTIHSDVVGKDDPRPAISGERVRYEEWQFEVFVSTPPPRGMGMNTDRVLRLVEAIGGEIVERISRLVMELITPLPPYGGRHTAKRHCELKVVALPPGSRGRTHKIKKLKRDHPEIVDAVIRGELKPSVALRQVTGRGRPRGVITTDVPAGSWEGEPPRVIIVRSEAEDIKPLQILTGDPQLRVTARAVRAEILIRKAGREYPLILIVPDPTEVSPVDLPSGLIQAVGDQMRKDPETEKGGRNTGIGSATEVPHSDRDTPRTA